MEQFASLRQKARLGQQDNAAVLAALEESSSSFDKEGLGNKYKFESSEAIWDLTAQEANSAFKPLTAASTGGSSNPGSTNEERTYYKAVRGNKRGDAALTEHLDRKVANMAKKQRKPETKSANAEEALMEK